MITSYPDENIQLWAQLLEQQIAELTTENLVSAKALRRMAGCRKNLGLRCRTPLGKNFRVHKVNDNKLLFSYFNM
jgi:hypothetical protein